MLRALRAERMHIVSVASCNNSLTHGTFPDAFPIDHGFSGIGFIRDLPGTILLSCFTV